jgi:uncharacterized protein YbjT (DUF2867 family)
MRARRLRDRRHRPPRGGRREGDGLTVRPLVRDTARAGRIPPGVDLLVGDLGQPASSLATAVRGVDAIVFTHGANGSPDQARRIDYGGVAAAAPVLTSEKRPWTGD